MTKLRCSRRYVCRNSSIEKVLSGSLLEVQAIRTIRYNQPGAIVELNWREMTAVLDVKAEVA